MKIRSLFDEEDCVADKDGLPDRNKIGGIIDDLEFVDEFIVHSQMKLFHSLKPIETERYSSRVNLPLR